MRDRISSQTRYYDSEEEAEQDLAAYMAHYQGVDSSAAFNFGPPVSVEFSHPWPPPTDTGRSL